MGQAQIKADLGKGQYTISYLKDTELAQAKKTALDAKKIELQQQIDALQIDADAKQAEIEAKFIELDNKILAKPPEEDVPAILQWLSELNLITADIGKLNDQLEEINRNITRLELDIAAIDKELDIINQAIAPIPDFNVWCCDYKEGLTVGSTIPVLEINDEYNRFNQQVLLLPYLFRARQKDIDLWAAQIDDLQAQIDAINAQIAAINERLTQLQADQITKQSQINAAINELAVLSSQVPRDDLAYQEKQDEINDFQADLLAIIAEIQAKTDEGEKLEDNREVIEAHKTILENEKAVFQTSKDNNEPISAPQITAETGYYQPFASSELWTTIWNIIALAPIQKWKPQYRRAEVLSLDHDNNTANVKLEYLTADVCSIETDDDTYLNINQDNLLSDVNVQYGHSGSYAFKIGDKVVIDFNQDFNYPNVIGFESDPLPPPDFVVEDKVDYLSVFYYGAAPDTLEVFEIKLRLLDENSSLFDVYANYADYDVYLNDSPAILFSSGSERQANYFDTSPSWGSWLTRASLFYPATITDENKPVLKLLQRSVIDFIPSPPTPEVDHTIQVEIRHRATEESVLILSVVLSDDETKVTMTDKGSTRIAPKEAFTGLVFELVY